MSENPNAHGHNRLAVLAEEIRRAHADSEGAMGTSLGRAMDAGELLLEAKAAVPHGGWLRWLRENCADMSERTAQTYMRLARNKARVDIKSAGAADLSSAAAVDELTKPMAAGHYDDEKWPPLVGDIMATIVEHGTTDDEIQKWIALRDACRASPGILRRVLDAILAAGLEPTREAVDAGIAATLAAEKARS
jgi:hypothetical protein